MTDTNPDPQPTPPAASKKHRKWPWIVVVLIVLIGGVILTSKGNNDGNDAPGAPAGNEAPAAEQDAPATERTVVYRVTGDVPAASITYSTDGMTTTNDESNVPLPWTKTLTLPADEAFQVVSIMAQCGGTGTIDVTIEVDGKQIKEAHADGYGVATASEDIGTP